MQQLFSGIVKYHVTQMVKPWNMEKLTFIFVLPNSVSNMPHAIQMREYYMSEEHAL